MGCPKREVALQCNKLMGMCDLMKSYFCDSGLTQQYTFSIELLEYYWVHHFWEFWGVRKYWKVGI